MSSLSMIQFPKYSGSLMYPPRPEKSIPPEKISDYENLGYVAQQKFNGTRCLVEMLPSGEIKIWGRNKEPLKSYKLSEGLEACFKEMHAAISDGGSPQYCVIDGELMNNKTKNLKDVFVAYDILVYKNEYLIGMSMLERYDLLQNIMGNPDEYEDITGHKIAIMCREKLWLAETYVFDLKKQFSRYIELDEVEGLVLKKPDAPLCYGLNEKNNSDWLIRCRKPHKNYSF